MVKAKRKTALSPAGEKQLARLRTYIDALDDEIVALLNERARAALMIGDIKKQAELPIYVPERELQVFERLLRKNEGPLSEESVRRVYREIISAVRSLEQPTAVAYLGPPATYTHVAAIRHFGGSSNLLSERTIGGVFDAVEKGRCEFGVVPIENSTEGVVNSTLDGFIDSDVEICAELILPIHHQLLSQSSDVSAIRTVYSHPQAFAQCRRWLNQHLPEVSCVDVSSTAQAAQLAAADPQTAALASELAASVYNLTILAANVEDLRRNSTRFFVVGHRENKKSARDRTSLLFALKDEPGSLLLALRAFAAAKVNLTRIESRPSQRRLWDYLFFVDIEGHKEDRAVLRALAQLKEICVSLKILGSYPQARMEKRSRS